MQNSTVKIKLKFKKLNPDAILPKYQTDGASGMDICTLHGHVVSPNTTALIGTGWAVEIPKGYELQIRSRSGLAYKQELVVLNSPGTIDSDYRGEVKVMLRNLSSTDPVYLSAEDRVAQAVLCPIGLADIEEVTESLPETTRGAGGFGSTGVN